MKKGTSSTTKFSTIVLSGSAIIVALLVLPGCKIFDFFKPKTDVAPQKENTKKVAHLPSKSASTGAVLCKINGESVIQESDFIKSITQMLQANPYFRGAGVDSLPGSIKRKFFDELVKQKVIVKNAQQSNLFEKDEFKKAYNEMMQLVKDSLTVQFFEKEVFDNISINENEVKDHYKNNKKQFIKSAGGILISGAKFDSEDLATAFLSKAQDKPTNFENLAKDDKKATFKSFGRISKDAKDFAASLVPTPIKKQAFGIKKLPAVSKVKVGKEYWVIVASDKKETVYFELDEINSQIKSMLKNNKFKDQLDKRLTKIKTQMSITINEDYFKEKDVELKAEVDSDKAKKVAKAPKTIIKEQTKKVATSAETSPATAV